MTIGTVTSLVDVAQDLYPGRSESDGQSADQFYGFPLWRQTQNDVWMLVGMVANG